MNENVDNFGEWLCTQVNWKFHLSKKGTLPAAHKLSLFLYLWGFLHCFIPSFLHCNSPNPELVNEFRTFRYQSCCLVMHINRASKYKMY